MQNFFGMVGFKFFHDGTNYLNNTVIYVQGGQIQLQLVGGK